MRQGNRLLIGRGYGVKNLSAGELAARREHHSAVLEYRRNRPEEIRKRWAAHFSAQRVKTVNDLPEPLRTHNINNFRKYGLRNQDNRPAIVPPPPSVAPPVAVEPVIVPPTPVAPLREPEAPADIPQAILERVEQEYQALSLPRASAVNLARVIATGRWSSILDPNNKNSRAIFAKLTGFKLPRSTKEAQGLFTGEPFALLPEGMEKPPQSFPAVKVGGRKRAARNANAPAAVVTTCPTCGKEFASDAARRGHMRVHKGAAE